MKKTIVIKFGGNVLNTETGKAFCSVVAQLPEKEFSPIIVHGGGPQINAMLKTTGIQSHFINGLRYTDEKTLEIAEMVLSGHVGKMLSQFLGEKGVSAVSISGKDAQTFIAKKMTTDDNGNAIDLGFVGNITKVTPTLINTLTKSGVIPIIAPIAYGKDGNTYNINADYAASAVAKAVSAHHLIMMTNISGLLDADKNIIHHTNTVKIHKLITDGVIQGGMIPKTLSAIETLSHVGEVNIIDGRDADILLSLLSGDIVGTTITR
ncbi:MAG: acetylglutamate kinase [Gammaproteobacteria bacterium]|nr:acetylglutamate kinase [Gammaproteobacteria bacterium]